jgi:hypothetical protein
MSVLVTYHPVHGKEARFQRLLQRHFPVLEKAGLVAPGPARLFRATDKKTGRTSFVEMFAWRSSRASQLAHLTPAVRAVWDPMEPLLQSMDIAVLQPIGARKTGGVAVDTQKPRPGATRSR